MKHLYISLCLVLAAMFANIQNSVAQSHVATTTKYMSSSTNTISQSFGVASTSGNLIVVHLTWDNQARSISTVTDTKGNTYARINGPTNWHTNYRSELWYAYNITGGGTPITITAKLTGVSTSYFQIYMSEYSGISTTNPLDQHTAAAGSGTTAGSGAKTTLYSNELIFGVSVGASGTLSTGATFTNRSTANQNIVQDKKAITAGSYNATFTSAGGDWVAEMATFKPLVMLPVDLVSFDAKILNAAAVKLDWVTATEMNNDFFELQRSHNGFDWTPVKRIKGAGNSANSIHYSTTDNEPYSGISYYRLMQSDLDGQVKYTKVVSVSAEFQSTPKIKVYPNPAVSYITVEGDHDNLQNIVVVNARGEVMNEKSSITNETDSKVTLNLSSLSKGVYFLKTKNKSVPFYKQ